MNLSGIRTLTERIIGVLEEHRHARAAGEFVKHLSRVNAPRKKRDALRALAALSRAPDLGELYLPGTPLPLWKQLRARLRRACGQALKSRAA